MSVLLIFVLVVYGITTAIVQSKIFEPIRNRLRGKPFIGSIVVCMMCCSFWVALAVSLLGVSPIGLTIPLYFILDAFLGLGSTWMLHVVVTFIEERTNIG